MVRFVNVTVLHAERQVKRVTVNMHTRVTTAFITRTLLEIKYYINAVYYKLGFIYPAYILYYYTALKKIQKYPKKAGT